MKRYFIITESTTDMTPHILLEADGPIIKAWLPEQQAWVDCPWGYDYCFGYERIEATEIAADSLESALASPYLITPGNVGDPVRPSINSVSKPSWSELSAQEIIEALGKFRTSPPRTKTLDEIYASMLEEDISTDVNNPVSQLRTAFLTGAIDDAKYAEVYELLERQHENGEG